MATDKPELVTTISILTRRLRKGKTYDDFRKAWFHTTGFGVEGKEVEGSGNRMYSMINIFDPQEVVVIGFSTTTPDQLRDALEIDVKVRGENPLDEAIEPEIGRKFCALVAEDDFSAAGAIPYQPAMVNGKATDIKEFASLLSALQGLFGAAAQKRDAINEKRQKVKGSRARSGQP
ncbi:MAG: ROK family protein [Methanomicrobiales archaeon]|nr:ROK family protein [Methanomicrobiales archaeon]